MQLFNLNFAPALLLLLCPIWDVSRSLPVTRTGPMTDACVFYAQILLGNITDVLTQNQLFTGIDCSKQSVELNTGTNTTSVCAPGDSTCSGFTPSQFNQDACLTNIGEDLYHYYQFLAAQPDPDSILGPTVLFSLNKLMENCFPWSRPEDSALIKAPADHLNTYDERLRLCKVLKGFHVRTITINRAIGFIHAGADTNENQN